LIKHIFSWLQLKLKRYNDTGTGAVFDANACARDIWEIYTSKGKIKGFDHMIICSG
jgi:hypothetical protein